MADETTATAATRITQDDLDTAERVADAAIAMWPLYAETIKISDAGRYDFVGLTAEYGDARFTRHFTDGSNDTETMPLSVLLDETLLERAQRAQAEREAEKRRAVEAAAAAALARRQAQAEFQRREDVAAYRRIKAAIDRGEISEDALR